MQVFQILYWCEIWKESRLTALQAKSLLTHFQCDLFFISVNLNFSKSWEATQNNSCWATVICRVSDKNNIATYGTCRLWIRWPSCCLTFMNSMTNAMNVSLWNCDNGGKRSPRQETRFRVCGGILLLTGSSREKLLSSLVKVSVYLEVFNLPNSQGHLTDRTYYPTYQRQQASSSPVPRWWHSSISREIVLIPRQQRRRKGSFSSTSGSVGPLGHFPRHTRGSSTPRRNVTPVLILKEKDWGNGSDVRVERLMFACRRMASPDTRRERHLCQLLLRDQQRACIHTCLFSLMKILLQYFFFFYWEGIIFDIT